LIAASFVLGTPWAALASPVSFGFTYQGELKASGVPMNGTADLVFKLFDAVNSQVGPTITADDVPLTDGRFTIELDFTNGGVLPGIFDGNERYLEITVNGTLLSPRQRLSPTPHANVARILYLPFGQRTVASPAFVLQQDNNLSGALAMHVQSTSADSGVVAIFGEATAATNLNNVGVLGRSYSSNGFGVIGDNQSLIGNCSGIYGSASSTSGIGVFGWSNSLTGSTRGIQGRVESPDGYAGYFEGRGYFTGAVGIRTVGDPQAMLDIQSGNPLTGLALKVNDELYVDHTSDFVGVNRSNRIGSEYFGVRAPVTGNSYGGMYMETESSTGRPFYGYSTNGALDAWTYFDGQTSLWHLWAGADRITVNSTNGRVGLGRTPLLNDLEVEGTASKTAAGSWLANSDARIKADVRTIGGALEKLDRVRLVDFKYTDDYRMQHPSIGDRRYMNVIAQEFREVFPNHVKGSGEKLANGEEILQVDTYPLTIYSAAAIQELHGIVQEKEAEIAELRARLTRLESMLQAGSFQSAAATGR
jgi:hypothetical protein